MRSELCLGLTLALASAAISSAQQTMPAAPPASEAKSSASPADAATGVTAKAKGKKGMPEGPAPDPYQIAPHDAPLPAHALRDLPDDVAPNPPSKDELTAKQMSWHGEWEADAIGLPLMSSDGRAVPVLYNKKGKRLKSGIKIPKTHPVSIVSGTLTVDGWTGKAHLNYSIPDLRYIYISLPTVGTVIVSQQAFPGSKEQKNAFNGRTLTVESGEHKLELASQNPLMGKKPVAAWVKVDATYTEDPKYPVMGYGSRVKAPYEWPGAKAEKGMGVLDAPPIPGMLRPKLEQGCEADKKKCSPAPKKAEIPQASVATQQTQPSQVKN